MADDRRVTRIRIAVEPVSALAEYASVASKFLVTSVLDAQPIPNGLGGWRLMERLVPVPYEKDYDRLEPPIRWAKQWDLGNWTILAAYPVDGGNRLGGAVVAHRTPGVHMLEGRDDLAALSDIRVHPDARRRGIGHLLFQAATHEARQRRCRWLKIETQNTNAGGCRFYANEGCQLRDVHRGVYLDFPEEVQFIWYCDV